MANVKMVTRTVEQTTAEVMEVVIESAEVRVKEYTIGGSYDSDEALLKKLKSIFETDTVKLVHIESQHTDQLLLGMPEDDFIRYAKVLPPRQTKKESEV